MKPETPSPLKKENGFYCRSFGERSGRNPYIRFGFSGPSIARKWLSNRFGKYIGSIITLPSPGLMDG
ncbi:MAG TPA: hypothetical protein DD734_12660 [Firmicutes bacterium]|nr:hypothetical protein [Bacillota bacterium]